MNIIARAILSCKRNRMKTLALLLLLTISSSVFFVTISSNLATRATLRNLDANVHNVVMITYDINRAFEILEETGVWFEDWIELETLRKIGELPYVRSFDYSIAKRMWNPSLKHYDPVVGGFSREILYGNVPELGSAFVLKGVHNPNIIEMEEGIIELVSGRVFCADEIDNLSNVVIVSEAFASLNDLNVGSIFSLRNIYLEFGHGGGAGELRTEENVLFEESYDLEIIGLFRPVNIHKTGDSHIDWNTLSQLHNRLYTPNIFVEMSRRFIHYGIIEHAPWQAEEEPFYFEDGLFYDNAFSLEKFEYLPEFKRAVEEMVPGPFQVSVPSDSLQNTFSALNSMTQLTFRGLLFSMGATILIFTLAIMLLLRKRKKEIGVYLTIGERKEKIVLQIVMEIAIVAFMAIFLALIIGSQVTSIISRSMLEYYLAIQQEPDVFLMWWDPFVAQMELRNDIIVEAIIENYDVSLNLRMIFSFLAIGALTTMLSIIIPISYILSMNPRKIVIESDLNLYYSD